VQGLPIACHRLIELSLDLPGGSEVVVRLGGIGAEAQGLFETGDGLVELSKLPQGVAQIVVRDREIRLGLRRPPIAGDGLRYPSLAHEHVAEVIVDRRGVRLQTQGRLQAFERHLGSAGPPRDDAEEVPGIDLVRVAAQDLPVDLLRLVQAAGSIMAPGEVQRLANRGHDGLSAGSCSSQCTTRPWPSVGALAPSAPRIPGHEPRS
jgi:hypothetical protein